MKDVIDPGKKKQVWFEDHNNRIYDWPILQNYQQKT